MELDNVACGKCGAPLQVPHAVRFVNCKHCGSSLEIKHTDSVTYSETVAQIAEATERIEQKLEVLELERKLDQLDRAWQITREESMVTGKNGHRSLPSKTSAIVGGMVFAGMGAFMLVIGSNSRGGDPFMLMGLAVLAIGGFSIVSMYFKAVAFESAESRYQSERQQLEQRLADR